MKSFDTVIIGAGPAGLIAATYLGRFRRRVVVLDGGPPRASWIPESHNTPGFPEGVGGPELVLRMRRQAERYGAQIRPGQATTIDKSAGGFRFVLDDGAVSGRFALLATGLIDRKPVLAGIDDAIRRSLVRLCPICDAFEAIDKRIAVLGDGARGVREARFLETYSRSVTLLQLGPPPSQGGLSAGGVEVINLSLEDLSLKKNSVRVRRPRGAAREFDFLYLALGCEMESRLAVRWGARHDDSGNLVVDAHQRTSIDGLYAAGDVVLGLNQIAVATAEAAIAATAIHNALRAAD